MNQGGYAQPNQTRNASYLCDHLATFTSPEENQLTAQDGMTKLKKMEQTTGVWTMKVRLNVTPTAIEVIDVDTNKVIERFPIDLVKDLECFSPANQHSADSDVIIFSIFDQQIHELHLFQTLDRPGKEFIVEVEAFKKQQIKRPKEPAYHHLVDEKPYNPTIGTGSQGFDWLKIKGTVRPTTSKTNGAVNDAVDRQVKLLDYLFSDIESFVSHLHQIAQSFESKMKRKTIRSSGLGDGLLSLRCKPPPAREFVDVLQKFKLSFILIAKLKPIINEPNAPDLIRFLFEPLMLVVSACSDPTEEFPQLVQRVVNPLITEEVRTLLENCLGALETKQWKKLGPSWISTNEQWPEELPLYVPVFLNGWSPPLDWMREILPRRTINNPPHETIYAQPPLPQVVDPQEKFLRDLIAKNAKIFIVKQDREASNAQEISLEKGSIVEVLNDTKNWWKVRNYKLERGFAPKAILQPYDRLRP